MQAASGARPFFSRPKEYDPSLADRPLQPLRHSQTQPLHAGDAPPSRSQRMQDLGFEDHDSPVNGRGADVQALHDQLTEALSRASEVQEALTASQASEAKQALKLQSFMQVNRSQTALMKAELVKTRRRLAHMQAVATRLREQAEFFQAQCGGAGLPPHLHGLPTEDDACSSGEGGELAQLTRRWESDVVQLQAALREGGEALGAASEEGALQEARQRVSDLEAAVKQQRQQIKALQAGGAQAAGGESAPEVRKELDAAEERAREGQKKLKQLAAAYKKLEQEKKEAEKALLAKGSQRAALPAALVTGIRGALATSRAQVAALKDEVATAMSTQLPMALEQALAEKLPELQRKIESSSKEWREKYIVECEKRRKLHNLVQELKGNIRVYTRVRPLAAHEEGSCISFPAPDEIRIVNEETGTKKTWMFNMVLKENATQASLFDGVRDLVTSMLDGYNVCIFAYGQTGSGKTHSMQGTKDSPGIYMRTFNELFKVAGDRVGWKIELKGAIVEVYNDEIRDLLADPNDPRKPKLQVKQGKDGNYVPGLVQRQVQSPQEVDDLLTTGSKNRTVACTDMNSHSSRSHLLVQIIGSMVNPEGKQLSSTITLVDLAGSERIAKSGVSGDRAKEAIFINKSLSALGDVINARAAKNSHTPFRNSTLTHLLQDSLSGDSKTLMLLQINPCKAHVEESLCSLQFGARVNNVEMSKK